MHMCEECAISAKTHSMYNDSYSLFERYDEDEAELFCLLASPISATNASFLY